MPILISNLTDSTEPRRPRRKHRRHILPRRLRRFLRRAASPVLGIALVAVVALIIIGTLILVTDAQNRVASSWATLARMMDTLGTTPGTDLTLDDLERLQIAVEDFYDDLITTKRQTSILRPFASLAPAQVSSFSLLDSASELTLAADDILSGLEPILFFLASGSADENVTIQISSGERAVDLLRLGRERFESAQDHLDAAQNTLDTLALDTASPDMLILAQQSAAFHSQINAINAVLLQAPDLLTLALGLDEDQHYLVLSMNNDEIRPSGGYLSTYGWLQIHDGSVVDYAYFPTTPTSPTPPPESMGEELIIPEWWFQFDDPIYAAWDGSWYADYPSTAEMAAWFYNAGENTHAPVDGVIAIDITGFEYLLEGLGSVRVEGYGEEVTPETFRSVVYAIREGRNNEDRQAEHKQFLAALYRQIMADWQNIDRQHGQDMIGAAVQALQEKHIMFYFADEQLNEAVQILGWAGAQQAPDGHDYLMVADANLGNKSNNSITRQIIYDVDLQPDNTAVGDLSLVYDYSAYVAQNDPAVNPAHYNDINYFNLLQVFAPTGSTLVSSDDLWHTPDTDITDDHTNFAALALVEYNTTENFNLVYTTPIVVEEFGGYRRYRLLVQKQPGSRDNPLTVQISLPLDARLVSTTPEPAATYEIARQVLEFRAVLTTDQWIEIIYAVD